MTAIELAQSINAKKSGAGWIAKCPAHDDKNASLSVGEKNGKVLVHCHAGCDAGAVVAALGLEMSDLFSVPLSKAKVVATYPYHSADGSLLFETVRYSPKDFRQRRPDGKGRWIWNLKGVEPVLFRLPELIQAIPGQPVFIAEGEKDVLALVGAGFTATCNPMGAGKWRPGYSESLRGANVVVIVDKDKAGRDHARQVAKSLQGKAKSVRLVELPDVNGKAVKDAADFFSAGGTADQVHDLIATAPEPPPADQPNSAGHFGRSFPTPLEFFQNRFPGLADKFGSPVSEQADARGVVSVRDISEDFMAATLGFDGCAESPTVFVPAEQSFYRFSPVDGIYILQREPVLVARLSELFLECARACREGCDTRTLEFRFRDSASLAGTLRKAKGLLEVGSDFFSNNLTEFIPCANGMLCLSDGVLRPFNPSYRRRNKLAVPFVPGATCPLFIETLMRPALEADDLNLLQRWCGLALVGENLAQKIMLLSGTPGGGKGTLIRVLAGIIGQNNIASLRPSLLGERFELGRFLGRTLLYGADVPENFLNCRGASVLKMLTGGDPATMELKGSNERPEVICNFNVICTSNSRLTVNLEGDADAWRRRLAIIRYERPKAQSVIVDLSERILATEGSGVLSWMLEGLAQIRADGWQLRLSSEQQQVVDGLLMESGGHTMFVRDQMERVDGQQGLTIAATYAAYVAFCNERNWSALPRNKFTQGASDAIARHYGLVIRHDVPDQSGKPQRGWKGLALVSNFPRATGKHASEVSGDGGSEPVSDVPDTLFPVGPVKSATAALLL